VVGAYFGGRVDQLIERVMDVFISFPLIVIAIAVVAALGTGEDKVSNVIAAITVPIIPRVARVVRASALTVVAMPFVESARSIRGCGRRSAITPPVSTPHRPEAALRRR